MVVMLLREQLQSLHARRAASPELMSLRLPLPLASFPTACLQVLRPSRGR